MLLFKAIQSLAHKHLPDMFVSYEPEKPLRSCGPGRLVIPRSSPIKLPYAPLIYEVLACHYAF